MNSSRQEVAVLGGGCFWCLEAIFLALKGVASVRPGYCGGALEDPDYDSVCSGKTGHAEVVEIYFDPQILAYRTLLEYFFASHDPTTVDRQGHDVGSQYRSVIFTQSAAQYACAQSVISDLNEALGEDGPVVTQLVEEGIFYPAEHYHSEYFTRNPNNPYCSAVIAPKLQKFRALP